MYDLSDIQARTLALFDALGREHLGRPLGSLGWTFRFDGARRRLGLCTWRRGNPGAGRFTKTISLSRHLAGQFGWSVMEDVARHEIAHALDYETRGRSAHDAVWKVWARRCGADPRATYDGPLADDPAAPFLATCEACGYARPFYRAPVRLHVCPRCESARPYLRLVERASGRVLRAGGATVGVTLAGSARTPARRWTATCPACHARAERARRPTRRLACAACCRRHAGGRFSPLYELAFARTR